MLERELKLVVAPDLDVAAGIASIDPASVLGLDSSPNDRQVKPERRAIADTYYDTADYRLARWGCTLRFRESDGWTAKLPVANSKEVLARQEISLPGGPAEPPREALSLVRSMTRGRPVTTVARLTTDRSAWSWSDNGEMLVELVDDHVTASVYEPSAELGNEHRWRELEVELGPTTADGLARELMGAIVGSNGTANEHSNVPKLVRAVGPMASGPPDVVVPNLHERPTAREVIHAALAGSVAHLILHLPAARLGHDLEGVHQARVATRRLRSDLRTFGPLLESEWIATLDGDLRELAGCLGQVRDADVLGRRLRRVLADHPDQAGPAADRVLAELSGQRQQANDELLQRLDSTWTDQLLDRLVEAAADPRTAPQADDPAEDRLGPLVAKRWRQLRRQVRRLDEPPLIDDLHRVRILAKRVRYAAEAAIPAFGAEAKALAKSASRIQDALGELNDAAVAELWLRGLADRCDGPTAFAAGRMIQIIATEAEPYKDRWQSHERRARKAARVEWLG